MCKIFVIKNKHNANVVFLLSVAGGGVKSDKYINFPRQNYAVKSFIILTFSFCNQRYEAVWK